MLPRGPIFPFYGRQHAVDVFGIPISCLGACISSVHLIVCVIEGVQMLVT